MKITAISDTHGFWPDLPGGDILIFAGDFTARDTQREYSNFVKWVANSNYEHVIAIAGNHDHLPKSMPTLCRNDKQYFHYLCDSGVSINGLSFWGCPWTQKFKGQNRKCMAFCLDSELQLSDKFSIIPNDVDVLITHSPPFLILDQNRDNVSCGSIALRDELDRVKPVLHVFGHIHEQGGKMVLYKHVGPNTMCANVSYVDEYYEETGEIFTVEF